MYPCICVLESVCQHLSQNVFLYIFLCVCVFGLFTLELLQIVLLQSWLTGLLGKVLFKPLANGLLKTSADENEITSTGRDILLRLQWRAQYGDGVCVAISIHTNKNQPTGGTFGFECLCVCVCCTVCCWCMHVGNLHKLQAYSKVTVCLRVCINLFMNMTYTAPASKHMYIHVCECICIYLEAVCVCM